jgi:PAS domain S-box-containing protein
MFSVLYVDDDPDLLNLGRIFLEQSGHFRVHTASSVEEALTRLRDDAYDGIISDYQMPDVDGIEFLRQIRENYKDLPFVLFTGRGREEIVIEALNSGADFYLQKGGEPKSQFIELEYKIRTAIERKRVQNELKESRKQMSDLINFLPDATFAIDTTGRVIVWNRMMEELTGVSPDTILGTGDFSYSLPLYQEKRPSLVDCIIRANGGMETQYQNIHRSGDRVIAEQYSPALHAGKGAYLWLTASPLYDTAGTVIGAIESVRDVTWRREAEEKVRRANEELSGAYEQLTATEEELRQNYDELFRSQQLLRESEVRYRNVVEDQTEFICRFTPDGNLTFVNDAYCRYFDLDKDACIGKTHRVDIPREDIVKIKEQYAHLTPKRPVVSVEHRIIMPSGKVRWQHWSDRAIYDTDDSIIEWQSVGRDVTASREAEEQLMRANEELNVAYEQLTATEEELRQNYDELFRSQQLLRESEVRYRNVVEDQTEFICRFTPDGNLTFVNDAYCRYFDLDKDACIGKTHPVVLPPEDVPLLEHYLAALTPENPVAVIDHRIIKPSGEIRWQHWSDRAIFDSAGRIIEYQSVGRDITNRKNTEQALLESNRKLNLLSSITRHDILNQLTALQGALGLIEMETGNPEDHRKWVQAAIRSSEMIRGQIVFTRMYEEIGVQEPRWQNLHTAATTVCMDDGYRTVEIDPHLGHVEIFADPLLRTVFGNLFENSARHGGSVTRILVGGMETPDGYTLFIEDDGDGVAPEDKARIFQKGVGRHTGLGLFLAKEVLEITGLSICETGEFGKGARFEIRIPKGMFRKTGAA